MQITEIRRSLGYFIVVFFLLAVFHYLGWLSPVENFFRDLTKPALKSAYDFSVKIGNNYEYFSDREAFTAAYGECRVALNDREAISAKIKLLEEENAELRKQIGFRDRQKLNLIPVEVVGRNLDSTEKTVVINSGAERGIKTGQPVVVGEGSLVGKVIKVENNTAIVRLLNDTQSKVGATVLNNDRSLGVVEGGFGISLQMNFIPRNEAVSVGDQIITSGLETDMPRGLLIGTIAVVENEAYQPFQQAIITAAADLSKLTLLNIVAAQ